MAGEFQQKIDKVNAKMQILLDRFAIVSRGRTEALHRVEELEKQLAELIAENRRLAQEVEFLKIATTIAPDRKEVKETRAILAQMVRDIDKCIAELAD